MIGHYHQGFYKPRNPQKYIGDVNNIVYRSSWELKAFKWLDASSKVKRWNSEEVTVKYVSKLDGRVHTYFVDLYFEYQNGDDVVKYLAEIKPYHQTVPPREGKNKNTYLNECITFQRNIDKWKYCKAFAQERGLKFVLLTEKNTGGAFL